MNRTLWLPFPAVVKARPRLGRRRKAFTPEKTVNFEKAVRKFWSENAPTFGDVPVYVGVEIHKEGIQVEIHELEESVRPVGILGDVDNYIKSIFDGLQPNGGDPSLYRGAFNNDKQIEWAEVKFVGIPRKPKSSITTNPKDAGTINL